MHLSKQGQAAGLPSGQLAVISGSGSGSSRCRDAPYVSRFTDVSCPMAPVHR